MHYRPQERQHDDRRRLALTDTRPVDDQAPLPESLPVSVLMERRPGVTRWAAVAWDAVAVLPDEGGVRGDPEVMIERDDYLQLRYRGLRVPFHRDEVADYYHNLTSPEPGCFIVAALDGADGTPRPVMVTLSFDEAHAYGENEMIVYRVPISAELYPSVERFVVAHYVPEQKRKRKLKSAREERGYGEEP